MLSTPLHLEDHLGSRRRSPRAHSHQLSSLRDPGRWPVSWGPSGPLAGPNELRKVVASADLRRTIVDAPDESDTATLPAACVRKIVGGTGVTVR